MSSLAFLFLSLPRSALILAELCGNRIEKAFSTLNYDAFILLSPSELQRHVFHQMVMERSVSGSLQTSCRCPWWRGSSCRSKDLERCSTRPQCHEKGRWMDCRDQGQWEVAEPLVQHKNLWQLALNLPIGQVAALRLGSPSRSLRSRGSCGCTVGGALSSTSGRSASCRGGTVGEGAAHSGAH